jgi:hypothetical protein
MKVADLAASSLVTVQDGDVRHSVSGHESASRRWPGVRR